MKRISAIIIFLVPFLSNATVIVENTFGSAISYNEGMSVVVLDSNNYFVSGAYLNVNSSNDWHSKLYFLDENLDSTSTQTHSQLSGYSRMSTDGNLFFFGGDNAGFNYDSIRISKATTLGQLIWKHDFRLGCKNTVTDLREDASGNIYISGFYSKNGCSLPVYNAFIAKLSATGQMIWIEEIDGGKNDQLHQLSIDNNGNVIAAGWSNSYNNRGDSDYYIVKFGSNGNQLFSETLNYETQDYAYGLYTDERGDIYVSGYANNVQFLKFDSKGNKLFVKDFFNVCGGSNFRIQGTENNTLLMLGSEEMNYNCTTFFMETDMEGNILWKKNWDARLRNFDVLKEGSYILTGYKNHLPEMYVVKFDSSIAIQAPQDTTDVDSVNFEPNSDTADEIETSINNIDGVDVELNFYPNPFVNNINVKWSANAEVENVMVFSMKGQVIAQFDVSNYQNNISIEASNWASGTYIIATVFKGGETLTEKVSKY